MHSRAPTVVKITALVLFLGAVAVFALGGYAHQRGQVEASRRMYDA